MEIGMVIKEQQPNIYIQLNKNNNPNNTNSKKNKKEHLSFSEVENMMKHDSYSRHNGALRHIRHK